MNEIISLYVCLLFISTSSHLFPLPTYIDIRRQINICLFTSMLSILRQLNNLFLSSLSFKFFSLAHLHAHEKAQF
jgi:hypothetical protein